MKLELKHLAPYLPHRLECKDLADETNFTLDVLNIDGALNDATYLNTIRLYLRPLSDLTKEIEVNGDKFVPIIELAKIESNGISGGKIFDINPFVRGMSLSSNQIGVSFKIEHLGTDPKTKESYFCENEMVIYQKTPLTFFKTKRTKPYFVGESLGIQNVARPYELFEKLFEWHLDVFGLIEEGLAIEKKTLKK